MGEMQPVLCCLLLAMSYKALTLHKALTSRIQLFLCLFHNTFEEDGVFIDDFPICLLDQAGLR